MKQQVESVRSGFLLLLAAFIWGIAFVAQSVGMDYMGPCTFNASRFLIGGVVLLPVIWTKERMEDKKGAADASAKKNKSGVLLSGSVCCGIALCAASLLQQFGIRYTSVGKAGFLTTLYIVIVPLLGIFVRRIPGVKVWCSVVVALIGMYLLCISGSVLIGLGDALKKEYDGKTIIIDGYEGKDYIEPDYTTITRMKQRQDANHEKTRNLERLKGKENITQSGQKIDICANIGNREDIENVIRSDAGGIGLI